MQPEHSAVISDDGLYRYRLDRRWEPGPTVTWVMLNPSTADADADDPTIRRCIGFAKLWGFGGIIVVNLFAYRATDPDELPPDGIALGPENDRYIHEAADASPTIIAAWGGHPRARGRARDVRNLLLTHPMHCLKLTVTGAPRHPLYAPGSSPRELWLG